MDLWTDSSQVDSEAALAAVIVVAEAAHEVVVVRLVADVELLVEA